MEGRVSSREGNLEITLGINGVKKVSTEDKQAYGVSLGGKPAIIQSSLEEAVYEQITY